MHLHRRVAKGLGRLRKHTKKGGVARAVALFPCARSRSLPIDEDLSPIVRLEKRQQQKKKRYGESSSEIMRKNDSNRESEREQDFGSKTPGEEGTCGDGSWNSFGTAWQLHATLGERPVVVKGGHIFVINRRSAALLSPPAHMQT